MSVIELVAGIDCGKQVLDVALFSCGDTLRVANAPSGHGELTAWLRQHRVVRVGLEASGGYERPVRDALRDAGIVVEVFDPARVRFYARATGQRAKTDGIDAAVIAAVTAAHVAPALAPVDPAREELAGLVKARRLLVEKRADLRRARATAPAAARMALDEATAALAGTIGDRDAAIARQLAEQPAVAETVQALQSARGAGRWWRSLWPLCCPNWDGPAASGSPPWLASPLTRATAASRRAIATSPAGGPRSGERSTWPRKSPPPGPPA